MNNTKYSSYIKLDSQYLYSILSTIQNIVAEILVDVDFEKKETNIYSVSNPTDGLGLKLFIVLKNVTYVNDMSRSKMSFVIETTPFFLKMKTFPKAKPVIITTDDSWEYIVIETCAVKFVESKKKEANINYKITNICEKTKNILNHKFDPSEYPIEDSIEQPHRYYAQEIYYDLCAFSSFMLNKEPSETMRIQFDKNKIILYNNNTKYSPTFEVEPQLSQIDVKIIKSVSLLNMDKLTKFKKISNEISIKAHKLYMNEKEYNKSNYIEDFNEKRIFDIDSLVIHPLKTTLDYDITFIINCGPL